MNFSVGPSTLTVRGERTRGEFPTTGRYVVLRDGRVVATAFERELTPTAPSVVFVAAGAPSLVILSTYTGGAGASAVPGYLLKLLVVTPDELRTYTLSSETVGEIPSDQVVNLARQSAGRAELTFQHGMHLRLTGEVLEVTLPR